VSFVTTALGNCNEIKTALNECSTVKELEEFTGSVQIPEELISFYFERFVEHSLQDIEFEVSKSVFKIDSFVDTFVTSLCLFSRLTFSFSSPQTLQLKKLTYFGNRDGSRYICNGMFNI